MQLYSTGTSNMDLIFGRSLKELEDIEPHRSHKSNSQDLKNMYWGNIFLLYLAVLDSNTKCFMGYWASNKIL